MHAATPSLYFPNIDLMHGSIPAVTIPPRAIPPGFVFFLQECSKFPTPGTLKLDNSPPQGITKKLNRSLKYVSKVLKSLF